MRILIISTITLFSFTLSLRNHIEDFMGINSHDNEELLVVNELETKPIVMDSRYTDMLVLIPKSKDLMGLSPILSKDFVGFKEAIGFRESSGKYHKVNEFGYLGKYQFGKHAMQDLGINNKYVFLNSAEMQEKAFIALCSLNKYKLRNYLYKYEGKTINGTKLTESGMLAAAHLLGPGAVINFIKSNGKSVGSDALGTSILEYLTSFNGYDTSVITPSRSVKVTIS
jgi:hypothetical protein